MNNHTILASEPQAAAGLCVCGCGAITRTSPQSRSKWGIKKGDHSKFLPGHNGKSDASIEERFWRNVEPMMDDRGCWEWLGPRASSGYGGIGIRENVRFKAHRVSWEIHFGTIPQGAGYHGICVCHKCDNRTCVNPDHLFLGTHQDNVRDMYAKGRAGRREYPERCLRNHEPNWALRPQKGKKSGFHRVCRDCDRVLQRERYRKNKLK